MTTSIDDPKLLLVEEAEFAGFPPFFVQLAGLGRFIVGWNMVKTPQRVKSLLRMGVMRQQKRDPARSMGQNEIHALRVLFVLKQLLIINAESVFHNKSYVPLVINRRNYLMGQDGSRAKVSKGAGKSELRGDELAAYAFDMLQSLREACSKDHQKFLAYLMGLAAEEALRLSEGMPSAASTYQNGKKRSSQSARG